MGKMTIRIDLAEGIHLGPGKVRLLELVDELGSISAAGRAMAMSYRRAWLLIDELNRVFKDPVVTAQHGGSAGGGAELTPLARTVIARYRALEVEAGAAVSAHLDAISALLHDAAPEKSATPHFRRTAPLDRPRKRTSPA